MSGHVDAIGGTTADIYVSAPRFPRGIGGEFGRSTLAQCGRAALLSIGGDGGLAAFLLAKLGQPTRLYTRLGRDFWGNWLRGQLEKVGVELIFDSVDEDSSTNVVATDSEGNRLSFFHPPVARYASPAPGPDTRVVFIGGCPHPDPDLIGSYLRPYRLAHVITVMDVGPAIPRAFRSDDLARLTDLLDVVTCNRAELRQLTGSTSLRRGMRILHDLGVPGVVVKAGSHGSAFSRSGDRRPRFIPVEATETVAGTVGAGDSFNAGLLYGLANGHDLPVAVALGNRVAGAVLRATDRTSVTLIAASLHQAAVDDQRRVLEV